MIGCQDADFRQSRTHRNRKVPLTEKNKQQNLDFLDYFFTPKNRVLCRLGDSEFDDGLGWNLDLLLRLGIEAGASFPFLLYELAKARQDEFAVLFNLFVCERAERLEEYSSGSFVGLGGSSERDFKLSLGHVLLLLMPAGLDHFKRRLPDAVRSGAHAHAHL